jgi:hypothetical protein
VALRQNSALKWEDGLCEFGREKSIQIYEIERVNRIDDTLSRIAARAAGSALLGAPLKGKPSHIAQLDDPCGNVSGNNKLVVENSLFIHCFVLLKSIPNLADHQPFSFSAA